MPTTIEDILNATQATQPTAAPAIAAPSGERIERLGLLNRQWANRPDDERFLSLDALRIAVAARREKCRELPGMALEGFDVRAADPDAQGVEQEIVLFDKSKGGPGARLTHASMSQLCTRASAPGAYLRKQPAALAAVNLSWSLEQADRQESAALRQ